MQTSQWKQIYFGVSVPTGKVKSGVKSWAGEEKKWRGVLRREEGEKSSVPERGSPEDREQTWREVGESEVGDGGLRRVNADLRLGVGL